MATTREEARPMATTREEATADELLEMMQGDPREVLSNHTDLLKEMQEETDNETLADYIGALLDQFEEDE